MSLSYYTVELQRPADGWNGLEKTTACARRVSDQLQQEGVAVHFLRSIFVPEREACFFLYEADAAESVETAARRAGLRFARVVETASRSKGESR